MGGFPSGLRRVGVAGAIAAALALMAAGCGSNRIEGAEAAPPPPPPPPPPAPMEPPVSPSAPPPPATSVPVSASPPAPSAEALVRTPMIDFLSGSDTLRPDSKAVLEQAARQFAQSSRLRIQIRLHDPELGEAAASASLLERRSSVALGHLADLGVPRAAVDVVTVPQTRFKLRVGGAKRSSPRRAAGRARAARMDDPCPLGALPAMTGMRVFPFPPPRPSTFDDLDPALFGAAATYGDIERQLSAALRAAGYPARSYFATCGGFALVTRVERLRRNGRPFPEPRRFVSIDGTHSTVEDFTLGGIINALLSVEGARFRVIVFLVTDQLVAFSEAPVDAATAERWVIRGNANLAPSVSRTPLAQTYYAKALIYEFRKTGSRAVFVDNGTPALAQLRLANIRIGATP